MVLGGALDVNAADKAARFVWLCDAFGIPLVFLHDVPGFIVGSAVEKQGIIRHGAKMLFAVSEATVPKVSVILRKSYGAGYFVMNGLAYEADYIVAWPTAEIAVMGPDGAVAIIHRKTLEAVPEEERVAKQLELAEEIRANIDPYIAAGHAQLDDVIDPAETRRAIWNGLQREPRQARRPPVAQARRPPRLTPGRDDERVSRRSFLAGVGRARARARCLSRGVPGRAHGRGRMPGRRGGRSSSGAGLAGLTAALDLPAPRGGRWSCSRRGRGSAVGCARCTRRSPTGCTPRSGGESIDDNHDQIQALIARFGLHTDRRLANRGRDGDAYYRGRAIPAADVPRPRPGGARGLQPLLRRERQARRGHRSGAPRARATNAARLDGRSLADFIDGLHLVPRARFIVETAQTGEYATEPRHVSLLFYAQQEAVVADVPDSCGRDDAHPRRQQHAWCRRWPRSSATRSCSARRCARSTGPRLRDGARGRTDVHRRAARARGAAAAAAPHPVHAAPAGDGRRDGARPGARARRRR